MLFVCLIDCKYRFVFLFFYFLFILLLLFLFFFCWGGGGVDIMPQWQHRQSLVHDSLLGFIRILKTFHLSSAGKSTRSRAHTASLQCSVIQLVGGGSRVKVSPPQRDKAAVESGGSMWRHVCRCKEGG